MRYIPTSDILPDNYRNEVTGEDIDLQAWASESATLLGDLESAKDDEERDRIIRNKAEHWGKLKPWLLSLSKGRCWYSDTADVFQHYQVEHFRPKRSPVGHPEQGGYWWLSFDWKNYRVSGGVANTRKGAFFPLLTHMKCCKPEDELRYEVPELLDPTNAADVALVTFDNEGNLLPQAYCDFSSRQRVTVSRDRYNLDFEALRLKRKAVWSESHRISTLLLGEREKVARDTTNVCARQELQYLAGELKRMLSEEVPLSGVARAYVRSRGNDVLSSFL